MLLYFADHPSVDDLFAAFLGYESTHTRAKAFESKREPTYTLPPVDPQIMPSVTALERAPAWIREAVKRA